MKFFDLCFVPFNSSLIHFQVIQNIFSNLLANKQKDSWFDLSFQERSKAVNRLLVEMKRTILLFLETKSNPDDYTSYQNNICKHCVLLMHLKLN